MSAAYMAHTLGDARREGRGWRCRCPLHGGRSLVLRDGDANRLLVHCWGGCNRLDVLAELRRWGLLEGRHDHRQLDNDLGRLQARRRDDNRDDEVRRIARARQIWDAALPAVRSPVTRYLARRGITTPPPATLRWGPRCWHREARQWLPAMIALVEDVRRGTVGVHRTYLTTDYRRRDRASLGPIGGGAVRLGTPRPGEWLAIAEGLETALAVMSACATPGWAALSEGGIRALILPPEATHVVICADHDLNGVGQRAAHDAAARFLAEGRHVRVAMPPEPDTDFNDVLTAAGFETEARHVV
jgi:putative DNA primase/helicase